MDHDVKMLYINLLGHNKTPKQIFTDWNVYKAALFTAIGGKLNPPYPDYVKMAIRYEAK